jgi:hypothetical protein
MGQSDAYAGKITAHECQWGEDKGTLYRKTGPVVKGRFLITDVSESHVQTASDMIL